MWTSYFQCTLWDCLIKWPLQVVCRHSWYRSFLLFLLLFCFFSFPVPCHHHESTLYILKHGMKSVAKICWRIFKIDTLPFYLIKRLERCGLFMASFDKLFLQRTIYYLFVLVIIWQPHFSFWFLGFISEFKGFIGIWRECGRWYDDHFPNITDRSFW